MEPAARWLSDIDDRPHQFFEQYRDSPLLQGLDLLSKLGDQPELRLIASGLIAAGTLADSDRTVRAGARMMIAHEAATVAKNALKTNIDRTRPRSARSGQEKKVKKGNHTTKEKTSFPSGHSAGAIAAARAFSREFPEYGLVTIGTAAVIALSQIPRRAHYVTDVAAGLAIGLMVEAIASAAWSTLKMDERSRN